MKRSFKDCLADTGCRLNLLLFPPKCVGCGELMSVSDGMIKIFCPACHRQWLASLWPTEEQVTETQGAASCLVSLGRYRSGQIDGAPERLIYHIKHRDESRVFRFLAWHLAPLIREAAEGQGVANEDILLTYPPRRRAAISKDGFDQAERLAKAISKETGWPVRRLIKRTERGRKAQKTLDAADRAVNAAEAYTLAKPDVNLEGKAVVAVDDLYTTGATLQACAVLLTNAGASSVILASVGRTERER